MPEGTVTFLFSDVEGSTRLLERYGEGMGVALWRHHALFEQIVGRHRGVIFETVGDAVYAAFEDPVDAVSAALEAQRAFTAEEWGEIGHLAVRMAVHTGPVERRGDHYFGPPLFRAARLQALGYGEQTLVSRATFEAVRRRVPPDVALKSLGSHRLKDLGEPERVYQLMHPALRSEFPALKSIDARPHNLPTQLTSFVGRERELSELERLLSDQRLVTLVGEGGIGKTRLALHAAADVIERHDDGVFFVNLAAVRDPELVPGAIASVLGLREQPGQPLSVTLAEHLRERSLLLVLDNLEQLLPAAARGVTELLRESPGLRVLTTSRAPLRVSGEQEYRVSPLAVGSGDRLDEEMPAAIALFVERARAIVPDFQVDRSTGPLIAEVCTRLDGLPLAIELAAQRLRVFGVEQLRDRLRERLRVLVGGPRDAPSRQQTLRAAIAWSEELLSPPERRLFARLATFATDFGLEAVLAIGSSGSSDELLDRLEALVDCSLVRRADAEGEARYAMLETVREYAAERLAASGDAEEVTQRSIQHWAVVAERYVADIISPRLAGGRRRGGTEEATARMQRDLPNARAALVTAVDRRDQTTAFRILAGLAILWMDRGPWREALDLGNAALGLGELAVSTASSDALNRLGIIAILSGDVRRARELLLRALAMRRALDDPDRIESALTNLARLAETPVEAMGYIEEALDIKRRLGTEVQDSYLDLAFVRVQLDDLEGAERETEEALRLARSVGDHALSSVAEHSLGRLAMQRGDAGHARSRFSAAIDEARTAGEPAGIAASMAAIAECDLRDGLISEAVERLSSAVGTIAREEWELHSEPMHSALFAAARLAHHRGDWLSAAEICGTLAAARASYADLRPPFAQRDLNLLASAVLGQCREPDFWEAWRRGSAIGPEGHFALVERLLDHPPDATRAERSQEASTAGTAAS